MAARQPKCLGAINSDIHGVAGLLKAVANMRGDLRVIFGNQDTHFGILGSDGADGEV